MRLTLIAATIVGIEVTIIIGMYYLRTNSFWSAANSDVLAFYFPAVVAAALCAWSSQMVWSGQGISRSIALSIVLGCIASAIGFFIAMFISLNVWGS